MQSEKTGRPRRYDFKSLSIQPVSETDLIIDALNELAERVYDQVCDLPEDALNFAPQGSYLTIGKLLMHLASSDVRWAERLCGKELPAGIRTDFQDMSYSGMRESYVSNFPAARMVEMCRRIREGFTIPALRAIPDIGAATGAEKGPRTIREGLMHLLWHWTYHSGHIGLIRQLWGSEYNWRFA